ncbi:hypothetical protein AYI69_g10920, partial [Smittium culicis]
MIRRAKSQHDDAAFILQELLRFVVDGIDGDRL